MDIRFVSPQDLIKAEFFSWHYDISIPFLSRSVRERGVLVPVRIIDAETPLVIDGQRRLLAAQEAGLTEIPATFFRESNRIDAFLSALHLNIPSGRLSMMEKLRIIHHAARFLPMPDIGEVENLLEIGRFPSLSSLTQKLIKLPVWVQEYFHRTDIQLRRLERLVSYPFHAYEPWFMMAEELNFKAAELIVLLEQVQDICLRDGIEPAELFLSLSLNSIRKGPMTPQQKVQEIKNRVNEKRFPVLISIRRIVQQNTREIEKRFSGNLHIEWDNPLERPGVSLNLRLRNQDMVKQLINIFQEEDVRSGLNSLLDKMNHLPEEEDK